MEVVCWSRATERRLDEGENRELKASLTWFWNWLFLGVVGDEWGILVKNAPYRYVHPLGR